MTYGWAILIVLVFIGALYYFGAFGGEQFAPRRCYIEPGITCDSFRVSANESGAAVVFSGRNQFGYDIGFDEEAATVTAENLGLAGNHTYSGNCSPSIVRRDRGYTCRIVISDNERIPRTGAMQRAQFALTYKNCESNPDYLSTRNCSASLTLNHTVKGELVSQAEPYFEDNFCGNGECDDAFGENEVNCLADCGPMLLIGAEPDSIPNDGATASLITATVLDHYYDPIPGVDISFAQNGHASLSVENGTTDSSGNVHTNLTDIFEEVVSVTATTTSAPAGMNATANVTVGLGTAEGITLTSDPASIPNDGITASLITATVLDSHGLPINGMWVDFSISFGVGDLSSLGGLTNTLGQVATNFTSTTVGLAWVQGTAGEAANTTSVDVISHLPGWFYGTVTGSGPIENATVNITNSTPGWYSSNTTNASGEYVIYGLLPGSYDLNASKDSTYSSGFAITDFDTGATKSSTATLTDEWGHASGVLELSYPYSKKDATLIGYWTLSNTLVGKVGPTWTKGAGTQTFTGTDCWGDTRAYYLAFNGATWYYVTDASATAFDMGNGLTDSAFSVSFWVFRTATTAYGYIGKGNMNTPLQGWQTYTSSDRFREYSCRTGSALVQAYEGIYGAIGAEGTGAWVHEVYTYDGRGGTTASDGMEWYKNGVKQSHTHDDYQTYTAMSATVLDLQLGCTNNGADGAANILNGRMNEVKVYKAKTLSQAEITALYNGRSKYKTSGDWTSATQTMAAGSRLFNLTLTLANGDASNYVSKIEILNASSSSVLTTWTGTMGTTTTLTDADFDNGFNSTFGTDVKVKLYLTGTGSASISVQQIGSNFTQAYGYNATTAGISPGEGAEQDFTLPHG